MKTIRTPAHPERRDRKVPERVHDPYRVSEKPAEPVYCPNCTVIYHKGRWKWPGAQANGAAQGARPELCPACRRIRDAMPAGEVMIEGWFVAPHKDEIIGLVRRCEHDEGTTHPLNRIIALREEATHLEITTTDIHLPRRIGEALASAYDGQLSYHMPTGEYFVRVNWRRDE
ncbi:MAG: BCAM0308 family protein [Rhodospirillaceae bacterium]